MPTPSLPPTIRAETVRRNGQERQLPIMPGYLLPELPGHGRIRVPDLLMPKGYALSDHLDDIRAPIFKWLVDAQLLVPDSEKYRAMTGFGLETCAALTFPSHGPDGAFYNAIGNALFMFIDDIIDDADIPAERKAEQLARLKRIVAGEAARPEDGPVFAAWSRWQADVAAAAPPVLRDCFLKELHRHTRAMRGMLILGSDAALSPTGLLLRRRDSLGLHYFQAMHAIFMARHTGLCLARVIDEPLMADLIDLAAQAMVLHNDIAGLYKDIKRGSANFVVTLQRSLGGTLQEACTLTGRLADDMVRALVEVVLELPERIDDYREFAEPFEGYVQTLYSIMRGSADWYTSTQRYSDERFFVV